MNGKFHIEKWGTSIPEYLDELILTECGYASEPTRESDLYARSIWRNRHNADPKPLLIDSTYITTIQWLAERTNTKTVYERFKMLESTWIKSTRYLSSVEDRATDWSYQQIIGMGSFVVPHILRSLMDQPRDWFWALTVITGENPISNEDKGNMQAMSKSWIDWGKSQGLIR